MNMLAELYTSYDELLALYYGALRQLQDGQHRVRRRGRGVFRKQDLGQVKKISEWAALYQSRRRQR